MSQTTGAAEDKKVLKSIDSGSMSVVLDTFIRYVFVFNVLKWQHFLSIQYSLL